GRFGHADQLNARADVNPAVGAGPHAFALVVPGAQRGALAGHARVGRLFVDLTVAVVVPAVADLLSAVGLNALLFAAVAVLPVEVEEVFFAALDAAGVVAADTLAGRNGVGQLALVAAGTAVFYGGEVEAVVDDAVAIVVDTVADLDAVIADVADGLAAVARVVVEVLAARSAHVDDANAVDAFGEGAVDATGDAADAAVEHVGIEVDVVAVVVLASLAAHVVAAFTAIAAASRGGGGDDVAGGGRVLWPTGGGFAGIAEAIVFTDEAIGFGGTPRSAERCQPAEQANPTQALQDLVHCIVSSFELSLRFIARAWLERRACVRRRRRPRLDLAGARAG